MNTRTTLLTALPLLLILAVLAGVLLLGPNTRFDIRPKAAPVVPTIAPVKPFTSPSPIQLTPETACTDLYQPVCGNDGVTYDSPCEAQAASARISYYTACQTRPTSAPTPVSP